LPVDLKTLTPDTTVPSTAVLFGADSQAATDPSVYPLSAVRDGVNLGDVILTDAPFISWNVETSRIASVTLGGNRTLLSPTNHKDGGEYKLLVFQDGTGGRTLAYDSNIVWPGGTAPNLSGAAANSLIVITLVSDGVRLYASADQTYTGNSPTLYHNFASGVMPSWLIFSRAGHATITDSSGNITWAPNNMLLNSATLSTQSVSTIAGHRNILSFRGTGSVTLSGTASGTLAGTGVNNRVSLAITPTTGSLTLTVSGQVLDAQLERVTYESAPRAYNPTTGVAFFGTRFDWTGGTPGLLIEEARTNLLIRSEQFDQSWILEGLHPFGSGSVVNADVSPDGTTNADLIVETSATTYRRAYLATTSLAASTNHTFSVYVKRATGSRNVTIITGGATDYNWVTVNLTDGSIINPAASVNGATNPLVTVRQVGSYYRIELRVSLPSPQIGFGQIYIDSRTAPGGTAVDTYAGDGTSGLFVWGAQIEVGGSALTYIPTFGASVTRAAELFELIGAARTTLQSTNSSVITELASGASPINSARIIGSNAPGSASPLFINVTASAGHWDGSAMVSTVVGLDVRTNITRMGSSWTNSVSRSVVNSGGTVATGAMTGSFASATVFTLGYSGYSNCRVRSIALYNYRLTDAALQAKSVVGASY
jgi:hypothetical protein